MKRKVRKIKNTKTKNYEQIKNFAIAILAIVILVVVAMTAQGFKIGSSSAFSPTPTPISPKIAYPEVKENLGSLPRVLIPGTVNSLYRFTVTAKGGQVALKKFTIAMYTRNSGPTSANADMGGFALWRDGAAVADVDIRTWKSNDPYAINAEVKGVGDVEGGLTPASVTPIIVQFGNNPCLGGEQIIKKGETVTYTLMGMAGTGFSSYDQIGCKLSQDLGAGTGKAYLKDYDTRVNNALVIRQNQYNEPHTYGFIWSDMSTANHSDKLDDLGIRTLSSMDWWSEVGLRIFPVGNMFWLQA